jgi:hypothetical protein
MPAAPPKRVTWSCPKAPPLGPGSVHTLREGEAIAFAGLNVRLARTSHKHMVDGPTIGRWPLEFTRGGKVERVELSGLSPSGEGSTLGVTWRLDQENDELRLELWAVAHRPLEEKVALACAEQGLGELGFQGDGSRAYNVEGGVLEATYGGASVARATIGTHTRHMVFVLYPAK